METGLASQRTKTSHALRVFQLVIMVGVRKLMEYVFSQDELKQLDDKMPEMHLRHKEDKQKKKAQVHWLPFIFLQV